MDAAFQQELQKYTLEHYQLAFADRHLLHGAVVKWAHETPDSIALIEADTARQFTYRQFDVTSTRWAVELLKLGFRKGDFLGTLLPLTAEHVILEYSCFKIGLIHAPLDLRLKTPEIIRSLQLIQAKGFVFQGKTPQQDYTEIGRSVRESCPFVQRFIQFAKAEDALPNVILGSHLIEQAEALPMEGARVDVPEWELYRQITQGIVPDDGAQVIYTTGSTGSPKPALLSHRNITAQNMCLMAGFGLYDKPRQLVNLPPSHVGCQAEQLMTTLFAGGTAVILHMFDAEKTLRAIQEYQVTVLGQVPAMFHMQWQLPTFHEYDLSSVQKALFGGQTVTSAFVQRLLEMVPVVGTGLGLSEMAGFVTYTGMTDQSGDVVQGVGWDMPITPVTIREPMREDGFAGARLPDGETGEICFDGPQVFVDYVNNREAYRRTVSKEGICYTGDLGYKSEKGLIFCGRSKLVIKPKGYQVHPAQIEEHFAQLRDLIANCAAVGAPHDIFVEAVVLFVEPRSGITLDRELLERHSHGIAAYMRPAHYIFVDVGQFPLNRVAKTDYVRLRMLAQTEVARLRTVGQWDKSSG